MQRAERGAGTYLRCPMSRPDPASCNKKEWLLFLLLAINGFGFAIIAMNTYNTYLDVYGVKPNTWIF